MILTHAQDDLNLRILHMFEGTFSLDKTHFIITLSIKLKQKTFFLYFVPLF